MTEKKLNEFKKEYFELEPKLNRFKIALLDQFKQIVVNEDLELGFPVQIRIKEWESIKNKIVSKRFNVKKSIMELQDLIGVRFILLSLQDIKKVEEVVKNDFVVIKNYNPAEKLSHDQFGYNSIHYILGVPDYWRKVPSFKHISEFNFELQIRTLSQHIWAETSTAFNYKNVENVPRNLLRGIGRISALLETIDFEIERLISERSEYIEKLENEGTHSDEKLNIDLTYKILQEQFGQRNTPSENLELLFVELLENGIRDSKVFINILDKHKLRLLKEENMFRSRVNEENPSALEQEIIERGFVFDYLGITRNILRKELKNYRPKSKRTNTKSS